MGPSDIEDNEWAVETVNKGGTAMKFVPSSNEGLFLMGKYS